MNGFEIDGRRISVEPAQGKKGNHNENMPKGRRGKGRTDRSDRDFRKEERDSSRPWKRTSSARESRKKRR